MIPVEFRFQEMTLDMVAAIDFSLKKVGEFCKQGVLLPFLGIANVHTDVLPKSHDVKDDNTPVEINFINRGGGLSSVSKRKYLLSDEFSDASFVQTTFPMIDEGCDYSECWSTCINPNGDNYHPVVHQRVSS